MPKLFFRAHLQFGFQIVVQSCAQLLGQATFYLNFIAAFITFGWCFCIALFSKRVQAASKWAKTCMKCRNRSKRNHLMQLGGCLARSLASRIRQRTDRRGVLPESLMRAINTIKSMLAGILSQTSGSWLFPVIYCPHHWRPIRACRKKRRLTAPSLWVTVSPVQRKPLEDRRAGTHTSDTMRPVTGNSSWGDHLQLIIRHWRVMNLNDLTGAEREIN